MASRYSVNAKGRVQGVGFRFFVNSMAITYGLTGWVKNLYDGSVQMEIQGPQAKIEAFLDAIREGNRFIRVHELEYNSIPAITGEHSFRILY